MRIFVFFLFLLMFHLTVHSQESKDTSDQQIELFPHNYGDKKWKFIIGLDARRSFFRGAPVKINGLKTGAELNGVHRFGIGMYFLNRNVLFEDVKVDRPDAAVNPEVQFNLGYVSLFYERIFLKTRWWEVAFPLHLGAGSIRGYYRDTAQTYQPLVEAPFSALLGSVQVKFYPLKWLALRTSGGYRITFNTSQEVKSSFNRPFYGFGLSINLVELYRAIFKKSKTKS